MCSKIQSPQRISPFLNRRSTCKDRGWFTDYHPFQSVAGSIYTDTHDTPVVGVGVVKIPVKTSPNLTGPKAHGTLILRDVLHCPLAVCNIVGLPAPFKQDYIFQLGGNRNGKSEGAIRDRRGRAVAYFAPGKRLYQLRLSGPPIGPVVGSSALKKEGIYMLNMRWPESERARWQAYKQSQVDRPKKITSKEHADNDNLLHQETNPPYTDYEKQWLKVHYGGEYNFLKNLGLSIFKEEDREEGRDITRELMKQEGESDSGESKDDSESRQEAQDIVRQMMEDEEDSEDDTDYYGATFGHDLDGHLADYHFDEKTLNWIGKHFRNSRNFMTSYGLKFYDDDDCKEAVKLAHSMQADTRSSRA